MEPGVDTYSIVTTLRVVLIQVKRESGGRLGPTLCWEVSLAKEDKVKSQGDTEETLEMTSEAVVHQAASLTGNLDEALQFINTKRDKLGKLLESRRVNRGHNDRLSQKIEKEIDGLDEEALELILQK